MYVIDYGLYTHNNGAQTETVKNLIHGHECAR